MQNYNNHKKHTVSSDVPYYYEEYLLNSRLHRTDGPAQIWYYHSNKIEREVYCLNGKIHRIDGPAIITYQKSGQIMDESYFINHHNYTEYLKEIFYIMRTAKDKTKTFLYCVTRPNKELNLLLIHVLPKIFKNDIDPKVLANLEIFF